MGILRGWKFDGLWRLGKMRAQDGAMWDVQVLMRHLANVPRQEKSCPYATNFASSMLHSHL